jgi:GNAT superfamily N-acetyltransferase
MIPRALRRIARRLGIFVYAVMTRPLPAGSATPRPDIEVRVLSPVETLAACTDPALELAEATVRASIARGESCVGAFDAGKLIGYAWFACEATAHVDGIWMDFDRRAIYIYRALVRPEYRGRGIAPVLYRAADRFFLEKGRDSTIICIDTVNRASVRAAERSGARAVGVAGYIKFRGAFIAFRTPGARRTGFRFYLP